MTPEELETILNGMSDEDVEKLIMATPRTMYEVYVTKRLVIRTENVDIARELALYYNGTILTVQSAEELPLTVPVKKKDVLTKNDFVPNGISEVQIASYCKHISSLPPGVRTIISDHSINLRKFRIYNDTTFMLGGTTTFDMRAVGSLTYDSKITFYVDAKAAKTIAMYCSKEYTKVHVTTPIEAADYATVMKYFDRFRDNVIFDVQPDFLFVAMGGMYMNNGDEVIMVQCIPDTDGVVDVLDGCTCIGNTVAKGLVISKLVMSPTVKTVNSYAFSGSTVKEVEFCEGLEVIQEYGMNFIEPAICSPLPSTLKKMYRYPINFGCATIDIPDGCDVSACIYSISGKMRISDKHAADLFFAEYGSRFLREEV